jgi:hypothetical protein
LIAAVAPAISLAPVGARLLALDQAIHYISDSLISNSEYSKRTGRPVVEGFIEVQDNPVVPSTCVSFPGDPL